MTIFSLFYCLLNDHVMNKEVHVDPVENEEEGVEGERKEQEKSKGEPMTGTGLAERPPFSVLSVVVVVVVIVVSS